MISADQHISGSQDPFELDKMAGMAGDLSANTPLSFDFPDGRVGDDLSQRMRIPQKITVPGDDEEYHSNTAKGNASDGITSMSIPDRIEIGTLSPKNSEFPRELRDEVVTVNSLSSMITPPRTLTVDDTKSAYYPQTRVTSDSPSVRGDKDRRAKAAKHIDDERYF